MGRAKEAVSIIQMTGNESLTSRVSRTVILGQDCNPAGT